MSGTEHSAEELTVQQLRSLISDEEEDFAVYSDISFSELDSEDDLPENLRKLLHDLKVSESGDVAQTSSEKPSTSGLKRKPVRRQGKPKLPPLNPDDFTSDFIEHRYKQTQAPDKDKEFMLPEGESSGHKIDHDLDEIEIFHKLLEEALPIFLEETNAQGRRIAEAKNEVLAELDMTKQLQSGKQRRRIIWKDVEETEMWHFFGLFFQQAINQKPKNRSYWAINAQDWTPLFSKVMSRDRFLQITEALHFQDNEEATENHWDDRDDKENYDPSYKIKKFWEAAFRGFLKGFTPYRPLSVDEQIIPFLGLFGYLVRMQAKPKKNGMKVISLCCPLTGYNFWAELWCGQNFKDEDLGYTNTFCLVMHMLKKAGFFGRNHHLYMDNYYTSRRLFEELAKMGVHCIGMIHPVKGLHGIPKAFVRKDDSVPRGTYYFMFTDALVLVWWKDQSKKPVSLLSSIPDLSFQTWIAKRRIRTMTPDGYIVCDPHGLVNQPELIQFYNAYMGGVDRNDQLLHYIYRHTKSVRWYVHCFWYILRTAAANTAIIKRTKFQPNTNEWKEYSVTTCLYNLAWQMMNFGRKEPISITQMFKSYKQKVPGIKKKVRSGFRKVMNPRTCKPGVSPRKIWDTPLKYPKRDMPQIISDSPKNISGEPHWPFPSPWRKCRSKRNCKTKKRTRWFCLSCEKSMCVDCWYPEHGHLFRKPIQREAALKKIGKITPEAEEILNVMRDIPRQTPEQLRNLAGAKKRNIDVTPEKQDENHTGKWQPRMLPLMGHKSSDEDSQPESELPSENESFSDDMGSIADDESSLPDHENHQTSMNVQEISSGEEGEEASSSFLLGNEERDGDESDQSWADTYASIDIYVPPNNNSEGGDTTNKEEALLPGTSNSI